MGNWTIIIEGTGPHDNKKEYDADVKLQKLVREFKKDGSQNIEHVSFIVGSRNTLVK